MNDLKDSKHCSWWRLYDQNLMTVTANIFLHSDLTIHWPSTHARFTEHWPSTPPTHHHHSYLFSDLHLCDKMRRSSWDPTQHNNHSSAWPHYAHTWEDFFNRHVCLARVWPNLQYAILQSNKNSSVELHCAFIDILLYKIPAELNETAGT